MWNYVFVAMLLNSDPLDSMNNDNKPTLQIDISKGKRELESEDIYTEDDSTMTPATSMKVLDPENYWSLNETITNGTVAPVVLLKSNNEMEHVCKYYSSAIEFDLEKMADIWHIVYYRMPSNLPCFKIHVTKTSMEERRVYAQKYGNFNESINWENCSLEIKSKSGNRKHFLQGTKSDKGVLQNIILVEEALKDGVTKVMLQDESADQWLVIKNILIMRDCDTGDIAVFSRFPHQPGNEELNNALNKFGDNGTNGTIACSEYYKGTEKIPEIEE